jgi:flagellar biosynthesis/type III secretory pathway protein FliH
MYLFEVVGNDGGCFRNEDIRKVMRNAEAIRNKRIKDLDKDLDAEMVKYLAAFVNSETILKISERKENGEVCTALNEMFQEKLDEGLSKGRAEGIAKGKADALAECIFNLMESAKWDAMQAMNALRIPESEQPMYLERVEALRGKRA